MSIASTLVEGLAAGFALARDVPLPRGIKVGFEGDSLCALHSAFGGGEKKSLQLAGMSNRGFWGWANILCGGKYDFIENKGVGGNSTGNILTRFYTSDGVLGLKEAGCQLVYFSLGINNFAAGDTLEEVAADMIQIWDQTVRLGLIPVASTVLTGDTGGNHYSARQTILEFNQWMREYLAGRRDILFFDAHRACVDPTSTTAVPKSGYFYDQTHPSGIGAYYIGQEINRVISPLFPATVWGVASAAESYGVSTTSRQILQNPLFTGTSGTTTPGSGSITGSVATNWNVQVESGTAAVTASLVADPNGFGNRQRIVIDNSGGASATSVLIRPASSIHARVSAGDTILCEAEASITDPVGMTEFNWYISQSGGSDGQSRFNSLAADTAYPQVSFGGRFRIPRHTMVGPTAPTNFRPILRTTLAAGGSATVELGRAECRRAQV